MAIQNGSLCNTLKLRGKIKTIIYVFDCVFKNNKTTGNIMFKNVVLITENKGFWKSFSLINVTEVKRKISNVTLNEKKVKTMLSLLFRNWL